MTGFETHPAGTAARIERLEAALTRANAATAAAYEVGDIIVDVVKGVEGPSLYMQDYRVSGPKPWGGGKKIHTFKVAQKDLRRALATPDHTAALDKLIAEAVKPYVEALAWYGEQARLARLIHSEGDAGRNALQADGGKRANAILAASKKGGA